MNHTPFPPPPAQLATLANWRTAPYNRWAFHHVRELVPTAAVPAQRHAESLDVEMVDLRDFQLNHNASTLDFPSWLDATYTDGVVILNKGKLAVEHYAPGQSADTPHIWMSVSKSILGLMAGVAVERGCLDVSAPLTHYIPELQGSAYEGATVRDALDMRVGVQFNEDYHATGGAIIEYRKSHLWDPVPVGESATDLRRFFSTLTERDGVHGGRFHYVSPNTDLLGWVLERATGTRYADWVSECLWQPIQAERDAYITVDRLGAPRCAGGFCAGPRDMARVGRLLATGGRHGDVQVIPQHWIQDIWQFDEGTSAWQSGDFYELFNRADMHYRSQWYVLRGARPLILGVGVFGQHIFVDPAADWVMAQCSSQPLPLDPAFLQLTLSGVERLRDLFQRRSQHGC